MTARPRFSTTAGLKALAEVGARFAAIAVVGAVLRVLLTAGGVPVVRWYYLAAGFSAVGLVVVWSRLARLPRALALLSAASCVALTLLALGSSWNSRDHFLRTFEQVRVGMSEDEVDVLMRDYMRGTNNPAAPQLSPGECQVYRHSASGFWNADLGIICYRAGRVVSKQFAPD